MYYPSMRTIVLLSCVATLPLSAAVTAPAVFGDHMVLEQDRTLPVWGWADPGDRVSVGFHGTTVTATAGADRAWRVDLPAQAMTEQGQTLIIAGTNTLTFNDVVVGDVWLCSGQSNMEFRLAGSHTGAGDVPKAADAGLRLFHLPRSKSLTPRVDVQGTWEICDPATVLGFSAVGYYFGRELRSTRHHPIGLIESSWGGTPAQSWTSREALATAPAFTAYVDNLAKHVADRDTLRADWPQRKALYDAEVKAWKAANDQPLKAWAAAAAAAKAAGQPVPAKPRPSTAEPQKPLDPDGDSGTPSVLFNAMIYPLIPYAMKGVIWYQGESNAGAAQEYATLFPRMITDWRTRWGQGDFPFLFVHLSTWGNAQKEPVEDNDVPQLRQAQQAALTLPHTGMASALDINDGSNIHPADKLDVGRRLALVARKVAYGEDLQCESPRFLATKVEGGTVRVTLEHAEGLHVAAPPWLGPNATTPSITEPASFAVCGADGIWRWAKARIDGTSIILTSEQVANPVAAAFAWARNPQVNVYNAQGLPLLPFVSDPGKLPSTKK